jgi:hypothetical protein
MITIKLLSARGGDYSGAASTVPIDGSITMVGTPCPLAISSLTTSSSVPLVCLGFGELPTKIKKKGETQTKNAQAKVEKYSGCNDMHSPGHSNVIPSW